MNGDCVFCAIISGKEPATVLRVWRDDAGEIEAMAIVPLNPCTPGHTLVIPRAHVRDFSSDPAVTGALAARMAEIGQDYPDANAIFNKGKHGTQTQFHLHGHVVGHVVPRREGDGLLMPWSKQHT